MPREDNLVEIFVDGACLGNPGPGGWAAILRWRSHEREFSGGEPLTTNNRMELTAAIAALAELKRPSVVRLYTDLTYVHDGITRWIAGWRRNGWRTADRKPVKNADLWQRLEQTPAQHRVTWHWIRGHSGHPENERVDRLARAAARTFARPTEGDASRQAAPADRTGSAALIGGGAGVSDVPD